MPLLTDDEQRIYDTHSKSLPLEPIDLFEMFVIGIEGCEGQFELDDWLVLMEGGRCY